MAELAMSRDDTDPGGAPVHDGATDPGPSHVGLGGDTAPDGHATQALLRDLAGAPLPTEGVRDTDGHMAAAYAAGAREPAKRHETPAPVPAVVLAVTQPMAAAPAREAPGVGGLDMSREEIGGARAPASSRALTTVPRASARAGRPSHRRLVLAIGATTLLLVGVVMWAARGARLRAPVAQPVAQPIAQPESSTPAEAAGPPPAGTGEALAPSPAPPARSAPPSSRAVASSSRALASSSPAVASSSAAAVRLPRPPPAPPSPPPVAPSAPPASQVAEPERSF